MAPEQARGERVDHRADLYGLAAVLYRALTGRPPLEAPNVPALMLQAAYGRPFRPREIAPDVPPDIEAFLGIALHPEPAKRFQDAASFAEHFRLACLGQLPRAQRKQGRDAPWGHSRELALF